MTIKELKANMKGLPDSTEIFLVKNWEASNEFGELTELAPLRGAITQRIIIDDGMDFHFEHQVLLDFEMN